MKSIYITNSELLTFQNFWQGQGWVPDGGRITKDHDCHGGEDAKAGVWSNGEGGGQG